MRCQDATDFRVGLRQTWAVEGNIDRGRFERIGVLGSGTRTVTERASVTAGASAGRIVTLVRLLPLADSDRAVREAFVEKGRILMATREPMIPETLEVGYERTHYVAREFVEGVSLGKLVAHLRGRGQNVPPAFACGVVLQLAVTQLALHQTIPQLSSRLAKTSFAGTRRSLVVTPTGRVRWVDPLALDNPALPHRALGDPSRDELGRLAALLFELLVGRSAPRPSEATDYALVAPSTFLPTVAPALDDLLGRALGFSRPKLVGLTEFGDAVGKIIAELPAPEPRWLDAIARLTSPEEPIASARQSVHPSPTTNRPPSPGPKAAPSPPPAPATSPLPGAKQPALEEASIPNLRSPWRAIVLGSAALGVAGLAVVVLLRSALQPDSAVKHSAAGAPASQPEPLPAPPITERPAAPAQALAAGPSAPAPPPTASPNAPAAQVQAQAPEPEAVPAPAAPSGTRAHPAPARHRARVAARSGQTAPSAGSEAGGVPAPEPSAEVARPTTAPAPASPPKAEPPTPPVSRPPVTAAAQPASTPPSGPLRIPYNASVASRRISGEEPRIPRALRGTLQGPFALADICVGTDGRVTDVRVLQATSELADIVRTAVATWRYQPFVVDGRVTPVCFRMRFLYGLKD